MDLLGKVAIIVILLIIIFSAAFALFKHNGQSQLTSAQAIQVVLNDLKQTNPGANITVINVSNSTLEKGSYNIVLSVVYNASTPCPTLFIDGFDYPATGLVPSIDNLYTKNCKIYGGSNESSYIISSPEIAIVKSYTQGLPQITDYVDKYGYDNITVYTKLYLNKNYTYLNQSYSNIWLINYTATNANYSVYAVLNYSSGAIVGNYTVQRNSTK